MLGAVGSSRGACKSIFQGITLVSCRCVTWILLPIRTYKDTEAALKKRVFLCHPAGNGLLGLFQDMNLEARLFHMETELPLLSKVLFLCGASALFEMLLLTPASRQSRLVWQSVLFPRAYAGFTSTQVIPGCRGGTG